MKPLSFELKQHTDEHGNSTSWVHCSDGRIYRAGEDLAELWGHYQASLRRSKELETSLHYLEEKQLLENSLVSGLSHLEQTPPAMPKKGGKR